jgi:hypothetical protein
MVFTIVSSVIFAQAGIEKSGGQGIHHRYSLQAVPVVNLGDTAHWG